MRKGDVLLVGGTGFVGRALATALLERGERPHIIARNSVPLVEDPSIFFYPSPLDNATLLRSLLPKCRTVVYLASDTNPGKSAGQPAFEANVNLMPALRLLDVAQEHPNLHLVFMSSGGTVYGNPTYSPVAESAPEAPVSYHGAMKVATESFLSAFSHMYGAPVTVLRPSNLYGPGQDYRAGFGLVRKLLEHLRRGRPTEIWGDGRHIRDYLYIDDFCDLCLRVLDGPPPPGTLDILNAGSGAGHSIREVCAAVEKVTGLTPDLEYLGERSVDVNHIVLDCERALAQYNWKAKTALDEGIADTWRWLSQGS